MAFVYVDLRSTSLYSSRIIGSIRSICVIAKFSEECCCYNMRNENYFVWVFWSYPSCYWKILNEVIILSLVKWWCCILNAQKRKLVQFNLKRKNNQSKLRWNKKLHTTKDRIYKGKWRFQKYRGCSPLIISYYQKLVLTKLEPPYIYIYIGYKRQQL